MLVELIPYFLLLEVNYTGTSFVVQWIKICLPMQGHRFDPWSGKIPCAEELLSQCPTTTERESYNH